jgi:Putative heavy-metal-binding
MSGEEDLRGLPPVAVDRVRHQQASGVRGSLLSAPAAAAIRSAGLEPVGEVFGCLVVSLGWALGGCGYAYGWNRTSGWGTWPGGWSGGIPGTVGGGIAGGTSGGVGGGIAGGIASPGGPGFRMGGPRWQGGGYGWGVVTPVVVSGEMTASRFTWARPYAEAVEHALAESHRRMLAEARALGADGVLGITRQTRSIDGGAREYAVLGTAVRDVDPALRRERGQAPWAATLTGEDCAAAATAGFLPAGVAFGYSLALKHEDWQLRQQGSSWNNTEVDGLT